MKTNRKYGWKRDKFDVRDRSFMAPRHLLAAPLPKFIDLRPRCPPVFDHGSRGACTANATCGAQQFEQFKQSQGAAAGLMAGGLLLALMLGLTFATGCWSAGIGDMSAIDIHDQFPEHHGGWLMVTNNTGATR